MTGGENTDSGDDDDDVSESARVTSSRDVGVLRSRGSFRIASELMKEVRSRMLLLMGVVADAELALLLTGRDAMLTDEALVADQRDTDGDVSVEGQAGDCRLPLNGVGSDSLPQVMELELVVAQELLKCLAGCNCVTECKCL